MRGNRSVIVPLLAVVILALVAGGLYLVLRGPGSVSPDVQETRQSGPLALSPDLADCRQRAFAFQEEGRWADAEEAWNVFLGRVSGTPEYVVYANEAERNLEQVRQRVDPKVPLVAKAEVPETSVGQSQTELLNLSSEDFLKHYPQGRTVRSLALCDAVGVGNNEGWLLKRNAHFLYQAGTVVHTRVLENNGSRAVFELELADVRQNLAVTGKTLELAPIDHPIASVFWTEFEQLVLNQIPGYRVVRRGVDVVSAWDPKLKGTLSWCYDTMTRAGIDLDRDEELVLIEAIDQLSGHTFSLDYVSGYGVGTVEIVKGDELPKDELLDVATGSSLLKDYVVSKVLTVKVGESFDVDARNLIGMLGLRYDVDVHGRLVLRRVADAPADGGGKTLAVMEVTGGEIRVEGNFEGIQREGTMRPIKGTVKFDSKGLIVVWAQISWDTNLGWISRDHLLSKTEHVRDLETRSHYEAEILR